MRGDANNLAGECQSFLAWPSGSFYQVEGWRRIGDLTTSGRGDVTRLAVRLTAVRHTAEWHRRLPVLRRALMARRSREPTRSTGSASSGHAPVPSGWRPIAYARA